MKEGGGKMIKELRRIAVVLIGCVLISAILYKVTQKDLWLTLVITFGTTSYHFFMRLLVGFIYNSLMKNRADITKKWYQLQPWEQKLYEVLHVKKWKNKMPTYENDFFDPRLHSWDEIAQAMCQAELVHETSVVFSFLPLLFAVWAGAFPVFLITSVAAACFDLIFVIIQRYNRPRIMKLANIEKKRYLFRSGRSGTA